MSDAPKPPGFHITNNHLALGLAVWGVFVQMRDAISAWALRQARMEAVEQRVVSLDQRVARLDAQLADLSSQISGLSSGIESVRGDVRAEVQRSYEADQGTQRTLDYLKLKLDKEPAPAQAPSHAQ